MLPKARATRPTLAVNRARLTFRPLRPVHQDQKSARNAPQYTPLKVIGRGTFGVVYCVKGKDGRVYAIKKVLDDPKYINREPEILKSLHHPNCIELVNFFQTREGKGRHYSNYVMEYMPETLHDFTLKFRAQKLYPPMLFVKLFGFQLFAGLNYIHSTGLCHRDMKPQNVLVDSSEGKLKICDFGSAKHLNPSEKSVSYIASRYYRAPELLLDCTTYTPAIDIWAAGCIIAETVRSGSPIFTGVSNAALLQSIVRIMGLPSDDDLESFNHTLQVPSELKQTDTLENSLPRHSPPSLYDLLRKTFDYNPGKRPSAKELMMHPFFDDIFTNTKLVLPSGRPLPLMLRQ